MPVYVLWIGAMPKSGELTLRQEKFVQVLTDPKHPAFCEPSAAYRAVSTTCTPGTSHFQSHMYLRQPKIQEAVRGQLSLDQLGSGLKLCLRTAKRHMKAKQPSVALSATRETRDTLMDYARLTGQLVEKREVKQLSDQDRESVRAFVRQHLNYPQPEPVVTPSGTS